MRFPSTRLATIRRSQVVVAGELRELRGGARASAVAMQVELLGELPAYRTAIASPAGTRSVCIRSSMAQPMIRRLQP
jgi:hypothetical protein